MADQSDWVTVLADSAETGANGREAGQSGRLVHLGISTYSIVFPIFYAISPQAGKEKTGVWAG
jgi:hypothetical protein